VFPDVPSSQVQETALEWLETDSGRLEFPGQLVIRFVLAIFYFSTDGEGWDSADGWLTEAPVCGWEGVQCFEGDIIAIRLRMCKYTAPWGQFFSAFVDAL
jgi:hypothetical protein